MTWGDFSNNKWLNINEETVYKKIICVPRLQNRSLERKQCKGTYFVFILRIKIHNTISEINNVRQTAEIKKHTR
jgi:hypothetical protein